LNQNTNIRNDLTCMVRQLPATSSGLPLELYCFANTTEWVISYPEEECVYNF
jgi:miniconductance mechanosensitive channel